MWKQKFLHEKFACFINKRTNETPIFRINNSQHQSTLGETQHTVARMQRMEEQQNDKSVGKGIQEKGGIAIKMLKSNKGENSTQNDSCNRKKILSTLKNTVSWEPGIWS